MYFFNISDVFLIAYFPPKPTMLCISWYTRTGPAGHSGQRSCIRINQTNQRTTGLCFVTRKDEWIFAVRPRVYLTFSWRNIGRTRTSHSANERARVSRAISGVRNIGLGGEPAFNRAPKRPANLIYIRSTPSGDQVLTIP